ncbi:NEDD4-binding protein 2 isoform X2 [Sitophilus oryzae]|uniref:NEDD4-binding protein 2 isoform X2 n=1 Tax=Sitophilus oryzae TaxID=7048 RepID=A0A6J2XN07_SITOR|nr:NEDD4-binding protein 2 isoform X2 [Sitophilus oryzae]
MTTVNASSNQLFKITRNSRGEVSRGGSPTVEKKSRKRVDIENAIRRINDGYKVLVIMRGLPGSGKSTLAKYILDSSVGLENCSPSDHIHSADDYFMKNGVYQYNSIFVNDAHGWNHERAFSVMAKGYSPVIIDNTNTQMWEMKPYAAMATDFGYILEILEPDTHWCFNDRELAKRNRHGVPKATIRNMIDRYDKNVTPMKLLTAYDCKYKLQKPPQMRLHPPILKNTIKRTCDMPPEVAAKVQHPNFTSMSNLTFSPGLTRNLMDFNEPSNQTTFSSKTESMEPKPFNSVDNLLMYEENTLSKTNILKPVQNSEIKLFDSIRSWGIDEKALHSWDIVTPLKDNEFEKVEVLPLVVIDDDDGMIETKETCVGTDDKDFVILRNLSDLSTSPQNNGIKIVQAFSRDINQNLLPRPKLRKKKLMLDKSCLTSDDLIDDEDADIEQLTNVFPNVPLQNVLYWYRKCNRDIDWTIELLLEQKEEVLTVAIEDDEGEEVREETPVVVVDSDSSSSSNSENGTRRTKKQKHLTPESLQLKRCIENKITISDVHYSDNIRKIKQRKYGELSPNHSKETIVINENDNNYQFSDNIEQIYPIKNPQQSTSNTSVLPSSPESNDEPFEFLEMDSGSSSPQQVWETVELNLGEFFVNQLEEKFGDPNLIYPKGFQTTVQVPASLARQLYTCYIESVYQQMDAQKALMEEMVKEDEEFARKLQESEAQEAAAQGGSQKVENECSEATGIPAIMREERQRNKWQKEVDKWKDLNPDNLAAMLTREKLFKAFPSVDKDVLIELLYAHNNIYKDTVDILLINTDENDIRGDIESIKDPPVSSSVLTEMREAHESCNDIEPDEEACSGNDYRQEAEKYLQKRTSLYEKAQRHFQRGNTEIAQFYSSLAAKQTFYYERANSRAATAFLGEHSQRLQDFNTLDLHFLYVKEAIPSLDYFLDMNINLLRHSTSKIVEELQIITGRGNNSQGKPRLRPAVQGHLNKRHLSYKQLNPGLLKVKITKNSKLSNEL